MEEERKNRKAGGVGAKVGGEVDEKAQGSGGGRGEALELDELFGP